MAFFMVIFNSDTKERVSHKRRSIDKIFKDYCVVNMRAEIILGSIQHQEYFFICEERASFFGKPCICKSKMKKACKTKKPMKGTTKIDGNGRKIDGNA